MKIQNLKKLSFSKHLFVSVILFAIMTLAAFGITNIENKKSANAANPAFFFSEDRCSTSVSNITKPIGSTTLYICIDGRNEEKGFLGTEVHIPYTPSSIININSLNCSGLAFNVCINLSESGIIKLLATGDRAFPVDSLKTLAVLNLDLLTSGTVNFNFIKSDVFFEGSENKHERVGVGLTLTIEIPETCGNRTINEGEECDGTNLNRQTCTSLGYVSGTLACNAGCQFDKSDCVEPVCNNNDICEIDRGENKINCPEDYIIDTCNNYTLELGEGCDPTVPSGEWRYPSCARAGYVAELQTGDDIACTSTCTFDYSKCEGLAPSQCGDGIVDDDEECEPDIYNRDRTDDTYCDDACKIKITPPEEELPEDLILQSVDVKTRFPITSIEAGSTLEIFAFANYNNGTSETVTSCFPCPTSRSDSRNGLINYNVSGPARFSGNLLIVDASANEGDTITFSATYNDYKSSETKTSISRNLIVTAPADILITEPFEEIWGTEEVAEIFKIDEPLIDDGELDVRPSAPDETEIEAMATAIINQEQPLTAKYTIPTDLDINRCKDLSNEIDTDGDGISDRTECYVGTDPFNPDSDKDGCWDGDEINQFYTDPLDGTDCSFETKIRESVIITDPQPGWIIPKVRVAGITPKNTKYLRAIIFGAEYSRVSEVINTIDALTSGSTSEEIEMELNDLESAIERVNSFISTYFLYEYGDLAENMNSLTNKITIVREVEDDPLTPENEKEQAVIDNFVNSAEWLKENGLISENLGSISDFSDIAVGESIAKGFKFEPDVILSNNKLYDVVAIAIMPDNSLISSGAVRFSVDSELATDKPIPRSIGGENIPAGAFAFGNIFINGVLAEDGAEIEIEITDERPVVTGDSEYGAQVFAIWESIVLTSSVIADSEQGAFAIQAPRILKTNAGHKISLYAVKADETTGNTMRSDNVNIYFRVNQKAFPLGLLLWVIGITVLLILLIFVLRKKLKKKEEEGRKEIAEEIMEAEKAYETEMLKPAIASAEQKTEESIKETTTEIPIQEKAEKITEESITELAHIPEPQEPTPEEHIAKEREINEAFAQAEPIISETEPATGESESAEIKMLKEKLIETDEDFLKYTENEVKEAGKEPEEAEKKLLVDMKL